MSGLNWCGAWNWYPTGSLLSFVPDCPKGVSTAIEVGGGTSSIYSEPGCNGNGGVLYSWWNTGSGTVGYNAKYYAYGVASGLY